MIRSIRDAEPSEPESQSGGPAEARGGRAHGIAAWLRDEILRGEYKPGDRLPAERHLAKRMSVNRSSIREALRTLEQLGLVAVRRGDGATVRAPSQASLAILRPLLLADGRLDRGLALQILEVHEMLVCGAARLSAERASDEQIRTARALLRRLGAPDLARDDAARVLDGLFEFVTESSGNLVLRLVRNAIGPIVGGDLRPVFWEALRPSDSVLRAQLERIASGLAARDALATEEAVRALLRDGRPRLLAALETLDDGRVRPAPSPETATTATTTRDTTPERNPHGH